jgi:ubiquinol-cytochrome c reductase cytochrome b subunit
MAQPRKVLKPRLLPRLARWVDNRLGTANVVRKTLDKIFPDHWSFMLGEAALYCFVVLIVTGVFLTFFYEASPDSTTYTGSYGPLRGVEMSHAYESAIRMSFDVRAGIVMRQAHHWAALLFLATISAHLLRVFFTGAFRRPREINWIIGVTMLVLAMANGFFGYSLLDDQLSGSGLRIVYAIVLSIPIIGTWIVSLVFGGEFPGPSLLERFYVLHILIVPAVLAVLISVHLAILVRHKHTHYPGPGRRDDNVVGERLGPTYAAKALALFFMTGAVVLLLGGLVQINPVWIYGPFRPADVSAASQPDWYMGFLDGALRITPPWEIRVFGFEIPNPFFPGVLLATIFFGLLYMAPFLAARFSGDYAEHHVLERPRDKPVRTGVGVGVLFFYLTLLGAASSDVLSARFGLSVNSVIWTFRIAIFVVPALAGIIATKLCRELNRRDDPTATLTIPLKAEPVGGGAGPRRRHRASP